MTRNLRQSLDPDGAAEAAERQHERRRLSVSQTFEGGFIVDGALGADDGATLRVAIDRLSSPMAGDQRTPAQRRADALVELATRFLRQSCGGSGSQRTQLLLTASEAALRGSGGVVAELNGIGAIPVATARRLTCDSSVVDIGVAHPREPLSVGRSRRTIPPAIRRALEHRDHGCAFPGCDRPVAWTEAHHLRHWADGGDTSLGNLVLLCRCHHRMVHEEGWALARLEDGTLSAKPP